MAQSLMQRIDEFAKEMGEHSRAESEQLFRIFMVNAANEALGRAAQLCRAQAQLRRYDSKTANGLADDIFKLKL